ncbi:hypothetical protein [Microseira wollei]|uniref:hypothetical protein n=1 Tax=Microseira wollei TaxID=467598 RepID=UPI001CFDE3A7|nr:hypothetical protein [Microseira wollei]
MPCPSGFFVSCINYFLARAELSTDVSADLLALLRCRGTASISFAANEKVFAVPLQPI